MESCIQNRLPPFRSCASEIFLRSLKQSLSAISYRVHRGTGTSCRFRPADIISFCKQSISIWYLAAHPEASRPHCCRIVRSKRSLEFFRMVQMQEAPCHQNLEGTVKGEKCLKQILLRPEPTLL